MHSCWLLLLAASWLASGCAISKKTVVKPSEAPAPLKTASREALIERYNQQANDVSSLNAAVTMKLTAGSAYTGVIEQYHEVNGFILAARPASIRVIGQAPVVAKNIFDMVSDGATFRIFIPSKNKFIVGQSNLERPAKKPIENLRPQHLYAALLWAPIEDGAQALFEEASESASRYYVLTVVRRVHGSSQAGGQGVDSDSGLFVAQKIWFDRTDLNVARIQTYNQGGAVDSDVRYHNSEAGGTFQYPRQIDLSRPGNDYDLQIGITKLTLNQPIAADKFVLEQPAGSELVRVGDDAKEPQQ